MPLNQEDVMNVVEKKLDRLAVVMAF